VQQPLLDLANPLDLKIGKEFFSALPTSPGVYKMFDDYGHLLYVGKAKNLRRRLMSYRQIKITTLARKSLRLVHQVSEIQWENCRSEKAALTLEKRLLRKLKPPFNVVNTSPALYFYFTVKMGEATDARSNRSDPENWTMDCTVDFTADAAAPDRPHKKTEEDTVPVELALSMNPTHPDARVFGAFRGLATSQRAFLALRRLLWLVHERKESEPFYYPVHLIRRQKLHPHSCALSLFWLNQVVSFFREMSLAPNKTEPELILSLRAFAREIKNCDPFHTNWIQKDIDTLLKLKNP
jgi:hypothetical protein